MSNSPGKNHIERNIPGEALMTSTIVEVRSDVLVRSVIIILLFQTVVVCGTLAPEIVLCLVSTSREKGSRTHLTQRNMNPGAGKAFGCTSCGVSALVTAVSASRGTETVSSAAFSGTTTLSAAKS